MKIGGLGRSLTGGYAQTGPNGEGGYFLSSRHAGPPAPPGMKTAGVRSETGRAGYGSYFQDSRRAGLPAPLVDENSGFGRRPARAI